MICDEKKQVWMNSFVINYFSLDWLITLIYKSSQLNFCNDKNYSCRRSGFLHSPKEGQSSDIFAHLSPFDDGSRLLRLHQIPLSWRSWTYFGQEIFFQRNIKNLIKYFQVWSTVSHMCSCTATTSCAQWSPRWRNLFGGRNTSRNSKWCSLPSLSFNSQCRCLQAVIIRRLYSSL